MAKFDLQVRAQSGAHGSHKAGDFPLPQPLQRLVPLTHEDQNKIQHMVQTTATEANLHAFLNTKQTDLSSASGEAEYTVSRGSSSATDIPALVRKSNKQT